MTTGKKTIIVVTSEKQTYSPFNTTDTHLTMTPQRLNNGSKLNYTRITNGRLLRVDSYSYKEPSFIRFGSKVMSNPTVLC